jgi:hypothetical protein
VKHMTPELIARFRSNDDAIAEPASVEWELQGAAYRKRLKEIRTCLPPGARRLLQRYSLHDARVLTMAADEVPHFSVFLELDCPTSEADRYIELRYRLAGGIAKTLKLLHYEELAEDGKPLGWCMYDEIDMEEGPVEAFTHSILFTGGWELRLTFFTMHCRRLNFLFPPVNSEGMADPKAEGPVECLKRLARLPA